MLKSNINLKDTKPMTSNLEIKYKNIIGDFIIWKRENQ